jgi:PAS domain-containing protein
MPNIPADNYLRAHMLNATLFWPAAGQALLLAGLCTAALAIVGIVYRRMAAKYRQLKTALDNMSQGLCMFDARGRITLYNSRYIEMYNLSTQTVRPGCSLQELMLYRKSTGLFSGDVDAYCRQIQDGIRSTKRLQFFVAASDGRIVCATNEPLPGGGWVSTHEDVT